MQFLRDLALEIITQIVNINTIAKLLASFILIIAGYFGKLIYNFFKLFKIKNVLSLRKTNCQVIISTIEGNFYYKENNELSHIKQFDSIVTVYNVNILTNLLQSLGKKYQLTKIRRYNENFDFTKNTFSIGGFFVNRYNSYLFNEYFHMIKFYYPKSRADRYPHVKNIIATDDKENCRICIENTDKSFEYKYSMESYIILIKLSGKYFFDCPSMGTTHIAFGKDHTATKTSINIFEKASKFLYKKLKFRKNYFIIIGCDAYGKIDFNKYHDWSDYVFKDKKYPIDKIEKDS